MEEKLRKMQPKSKSSVKIKLNLVKLRSKRISIVQK